MPLSSYLDSSKNGLPLFSVGVHSSGVVCTGVQKDDGALGSTLVVEKRVDLSDNCMSHAVPLTLKSSSIPCRSSPLVSFL